MIAVLSAAAENCGNEAFLFLSLAFLQTNQ